MAEDTPTAGASSVRGKSCGPSTAHGVWVFLSCWCWRQTSGGRDGLQAEGEKGIPHVNAASGRAVVASS